MHSSQRFSLEPVLEVAVELASSVADVAKVETAPSGPEKVITDDKNNSKYTKSLLVCMMT